MDNKKESNKFALAIFVVLCVFYFLQTYLYALNILDKSTYVIGSMLSLPVILIGGLSFISIRNTNPGEIESRGNSNYIYKVGYIIIGILHLYIIACNYFFSDPFLLILIGGYVHIFLYIIVLISSHFFKKLNQ